MLVVLLAAVTAAFAQDRVRPQEEEERAYCRYLTEQAKASSTLLRMPNAESGVTQPNTGTTPQTYAGISGSLSNLRKAHFTDEAAKHNCQLFVVTSNAADSIKYAVMSLERDAAKHRIQALNMGIQKLDSLIAQST